MIASLLRRPPIRLIALAAFVPATACGSASASSAELWSALGGAVTCGIAIHPANRPPTRLLCSAQHVPPPAGRGVGDPGFVFLRSTGRPALARLSQDSFAGGHAVTLKGGNTWNFSAIGVTCTVSATTVRCSNRSAHGFAITRGGYRGF